jgi:hypothetical protein
MKLLLDYRTSAIIELHANKFKNKPPINKKKKKKKPPPVTQHTPPSTSEAGYHLATPIQDRSSY